jgi:N4-gp56 family major capsid protein
MALSAGWGTGASVTTTTGANFIPELWSDDIIASYKQNLVLGNLVSKINHNGQKGDTIHIPTPTRGTASAKAAEGQVTLAANTHGTTDISINLHYEYSKLIEDITAVQAMDSLRRFYTDDAGYALARQIDWDIHLLGTGFEGLTGTAGTIQTDAITDGVVTYNQGVVYDSSAHALAAWSTTANTNTGNAEDLTDEGIRLLMKHLDDNDVPQDGRVLVVPPSQRSALLGIDRFVSTDFGGASGGGNAVKNGVIGSIYGIEVYVSTACPFVADAGATEDQRAAMFFHKDAIVFVEQMSIRSQTQYKQEYLADLLTSDTIYGKGILRANAGVAVIVPN